jgi:hypothetical protein
MHRSAREKRKPGPCFCEREIYACTAARVRSLAFIIRFAGSCARLPSEPAQVRGAELPPDFGQAEVRPGAEMTSRRARRDFCFGGQVALVDGLASLARRTM